MNIRHITPADEEWPAQLGGDMCSELWVRGSLVNLSEATAGSVAIVGSRSATSYGADVASSMANSLAGDRNDPRAIVSGAAFGIDQAAHRGALAAHGVTIAVLACGVDRVYPSAHRQLLDYIADTGAIVSAYPPGTGPTRTQFLARNRIIAALSAGVVVVEAAVRSGALSTARHALELGRPVMAVPGPVTSATSVGPHSLIRHDKAALVTSADDVRELLGGWA